MSFQGSRRLNQISVSTARVMKTLQCPMTVSPVSVIYAEKLAEPKEELPLSSEKMPQSLLHGAPGTVGRVHGPWSTMCGTKQMS